MIEVQDEVRIVTAFKQRDAEGGRVAAYRLAVYRLNRPDNFGDPATSCVIEPVEVPAPKAAEAKSDHMRVTLAVRDVIAAAGGEAVRFGEIVKRSREACKVIGEKSDAGAQKAVSRALGELTESHVIERCAVPRGYYRLNGQGR
jgi:hypothetical protein